MKNGRPKKVILSARIKSPHETKGFGYHLCKAIKRTVLNVIIVFFLFALLYYTDCFWMVESPITLTPIDISRVKDPVVSKEGGKDSSRENYELMFVDHLYQGMVSGPESFVFYGDNIITTCADGKVVMLGPNNETRVLYSRCDKAGNETECGRPLGIELEANRTVFFLDSYHGLFRLDLDTLKQAKLFPPDQTSLEALQIRFLNSLLVDPDFIYFSYSSAVYHREQFAESFIDAECSGGVVKLDRKSLEHSILVSGLCFPNGIEGDVKDSGYFILSEITTARILRVKKKDGATSVFVDGLPGYPDNIRTDGKGYWIGFSASRLNLVSEVLYDRPFVRLLLKYLLRYGIVNPVNLAPPYGLVGYVDSSGTLTKLLHDPTGHGAQKVSEAAPHKGHLYIGSYHPRFRWISRYKLKE